MRLRNIPRAESVLEACKEVVKNPESLCGHWNQEFQNERPLHIEIGMGKGQFLLTLAAETVEFKTDNHPLFDFSVEELKTSELFVLDQLSYNLHNDSKMNQGNIMTEYEAKFSSMGNPICKLIAKRR